MESIAEVVYVSEKRLCTSCKVLKGEGFFVKCRCGPGAFFKTCKTCRDNKTRYRERVKASKAMSVDDVSMSVSSSTTPADYFGLPPYPPGLGL